MVRPKEDRKVSNLIEPINLYPDFYCKISSSSSTVQFLRNFWRTAIIGFFFIKLTVTKSQGWEVTCKVTEERKVWGVRSLLKSRKIQIPLSYLIWFDKRKTERFCNSFRPINLYPDFCCKISSRSTVQFLRNFWKLSNIRIFFGKTHCREESVIELASRMMEEREVWDVKSLLKSRKIQMLLSYLIWFGKRKTENFEILLNQ